MACEAADLPPGGYIPKLKGIVRTAGKRIAPVMAESDGKDRILIACEAADLTPGGYFPKLKGFVNTAGKRIAAVGAESDGSDPA